MSPIILTIDSQSLPFETKGRWVRVCGRPVLCHICNEICSWVTLSPPCRYDVMVAYHPSKLGVPVRIWLSAPHAGRRTIRQPDGKKPIDSDIEKSIRYFNSTKRNFMNCVGYAYTIIRRIVSSWLSAIGIKLGRAKSLYV